MRNLWAIANATSILMLLVAARSYPQRGMSRQLDQPPPTGISTQTLQVGTQLVVLDATVFDHAGRIVTQVLGKDDFLIEEDDRSQVIRNFEAQMASTTATGGAGEAGE